MSPLKMNFSGSGQGQPGCINFLLVLIVQGDVIVDHRH